MIQNTPARSLRAGLLTGLAIFALAFAAAASRASTNNLLINGDFNAGGSGWTTWGWHSESWGSHWASIEIPSKLADGTHISGNGGFEMIGVYDLTPQLSVGANGGGGAGAYQVIAAAENVEYTLVVQGGIEDWWLPVGEIRLIFEDAAHAELSRNVVKTSDGIHAPQVPDDLYDVGVAYQNWTNVAITPAGTKFLKVELCNPVGTGSVWYDNAVLTAPIDPPVIGDLYPSGTRLLSTNRLSFTVSSAAPINASGVQVTVNEADVSSSLVITGSGTTNLNVSYSGLISNRVYAAVITVTDTVNLSSFKTVDFDTYAPTFVWEAEDFDYTDNGVPGQFINNPVLSGTPIPGSYFGVSGTEGIDFHDRAGSGDHSYRSLDPMATSNTGDVPRENFVTAGVADYNLGWFDGSGFSDNVGISSYQAAEWVNYTRTFVAGSYNLYARIASGNGATATVPVSRVIGGHGTAEQVASELGAFRFPSAGWGSYAYVPLTDQFGNRVKVALTNAETLKVFAGSGANLNFLMLLPADQEIPTITEVYPDGRTLVQGTNKLTFNVTSATHSIAQGNVQVTLNGVTNNALTFNGSTSSWNVSVPLMINSTNYTAVITVTDDAGNTHSTTVYFDTFNPASYAFEAEDWDFNGGEFIDNPVLASAPQEDSYFEKLGTAADSFQGDTAPPPTAPFRYRTLDTLATDVCGDTPTRALLAAQLTNVLAFNYNLAYWTSNAWANYTHIYPTGNFHVYARLAGENAATNLVQLDKVVSSTPEYLGTFRFVGRGYNNFDWVPLINLSDGERVTVALSGQATLRTTTFGNANPNSYLLVPVSLAPEPLQASYAGGVLTLSWNNPAFHLQSQTSAAGSGITSNWTDHPNGSTSPVQVPVSPSSGAMFFRLSN